MGGNFYTSEQTCRLSARYILKRAILQAYLIKTTQIYKGRHIFLLLSMPGKLSDCGGLKVRTSLLLRKRAWQYLLQTFTTKQKLQHQILFYKPGYSAFYNV